MSHNTLAIISALFSIVGFLPYVHGIYRGSIKPHLFTWLIWTIITAVIFAAQLISGGGAGAWATFAITVPCALGFLISIYKGEKSRTRFDWVCLGGALVSIVLWLLVGRPLFSVILLTLIELLAFGPTVRKTLLDPYSESLTYFLITTFKYVFATIALDRLTLETALYPIATGFMGLSFALMIVVCRLIKSQKARQ